MIMSDHHDHHLPPPEPDHINAISLTFWGLISFIAVLASVVGLSGYFWLEREGVLGDLVDQYESRELRNQQTAEAADKLNGYTPLFAVVNNGEVSGYYPSAEAAKLALSKESLEDFNSSKVMDAQRTRLPIQRAMELVIAERAKPMAPPQPLMAKVEGPAADPMAEATLVVDPALAAQGKQIFNMPTKLCATCHSVDGSKKIGPSMKGLWNKVEELADGSQVRVNSAYFKRSVKKPAAQVVKGFENAAMPQLPISDEEITALMHYVASIK
jgi:mono/diheme cytochrome c family protein